MKRKLFVILLALAICVSAAVPAMAASGPEGNRCRVNHCARQSWCFCIPCPSHPSVPGEPDVPVEPGEPDEPDVPVEPDEPDVPVVPGEPDAPVVPDEPDVPVVPDEPDGPVEPGEPEIPAGVQEYEAQVVALVNRERAAYGLDALSLDEALCRYARVKSQDMHDSRYFDHNSPNYGSPFDMMRQYGITYAHAGENIAMGYATPEAVVQAWMNSSGHRANILSANFTRLGVGYVAEGGYWTQWFIG